VARLGDMAPDSEDVWQTSAGTAYPLEQRDSNAAHAACRPEVFLTTSSESALPVDRRTVAPMRE